ncbi:MAG: ProQ/FinO family protein [Burkholderiaceae bacterium]|nr:ProQ/FinO family protein [Burkholderiaceae bacterium]
MPDTPDLPPPPETLATPLPAAVAAAPAAPAPRPAELSPAACGELLRQHFPALFGGPPKPLKLRIQADIQQRAPGVFSKGSLSAFFRRYTGSTGYLIALGKASQRFDLDGQPAGELSDEHRQLAREELQRRRQLGREREQQAQARQLAQEAEQRQARQARAALLRDYDRSTLTAANFCALKGLTAETLEALLAQARQEAAEAPPPRPAADRRGPTGPRPDSRPPRPAGRDGRGPRPAGR